MKQKYFLRGPKYSMDIFPIIEKVIDNNIDQTFVEPFFTTDYTIQNLPRFSRYIINSDKETINMLGHLKESMGFIEQVECYFKLSSNNADYYKVLAERYKLSLPSAKKAEIYYYLNRHCFCGIMHWNKNKSFRTAFGQYKEVVFPEKEMKLFKKYLDNISLLSIGYEKVLMDCGFGDIVFCQLPLKYEAENLSELCKQAAQKGAKIIVVDKIGSEKFHKSCTDIQYVDNKVVVVYNF